MFVRSKPFVGGRQSFAERYSVTPPEVVESADVEQLTRGAVGLRAVELDRHPRGNDVADALGELAYRQVFSSADVDVFVAVVALHQEKTRVGEVIDVAELDEKGRLLRLRAFFDLGGARKLGPLEPRR